MMGRSACWMGYGAEIHSSTISTTPTSLAAGPSLSSGMIVSASAVAVSGHIVAALAVVNAIGSATIGDGPHFWAAPFEIGAEFGGRGWPAAFGPAVLAPRLKGQAGGVTAPATTIAVIATDAVLTKAQVKRLAIMANDGLARAILPAHAPSDGDTVFAAATGATPLASERDLALIGHAATQVMARAIARGVYEAAGLPYHGAITSWRERFA